MSGARPRDTGVNRPPSPVTRLVFPLDDATDADHPPLLKSFPVAVNGLRFVLRGAVLPGDVFVALDRPDESGRALPFNAASLRNVSDPFFLPVVILSHNLRDVEVYVANAVAGGRLEVYGFVDAYNLPPPGGGTVVLELPEEMPPTPILPPDVMPPSLPRIAQTQASLRTAVDEDDLEIDAADADRIGWSIENAGDDNVAVYFDATGGGVDFDDAGIILPAFGKYEQPSDGVLWSGTIRARTALEGSSVVVFQKWGIT